MTKIILASQSAIRKTVLHNAGINVITQPADIDERLIVANAGGETAFSPDKMAVFLAEEKAKAVSRCVSNDAFVIGADQVLSLYNQILHKAQDMRAAKTRICELSGQTHHLNAGIALARGGEILWSHCNICKLKMRHLTEDQIEAYMQVAGDNILSSVGCYQLETVGAQLFEHIDGDYFAILGLPLLPLISALQDEGIEIFSHQG